jgi:hypothetical protein
LIVFAKLNPHLLKKKIEEYNAGLLINNNTCRPEERMRNVSNPLLDKLRIEISRVFFYSFEPCER